MLKLKLTKDVFPPQMSVLAAAYSHYASGVTDAISLLRALRAESPELRGFLRQPHAQPLSLRAFLYRPLQASFLFFNYEKIFYFLNQLLRRLVDGLIR